MAAPPVPPTPPPPPSTAISKASSIILGKYQLGRLLGRGSFAKVYQAQSLKENKTYAVKIIEKPATGDAHMEPRITREVSAMKKLQHHPNILKIHEVMATKTKIYLVMELAKGGELFTKIARRGRLTEASARRYFQQLVSALHFCHQNGVAHRDVKPQNLLLDQDGNLKVSDFGLSALPEQLRDGLLHTACGTPAYTAPEVVTRRGAGYDGAKTDAWSCGVILFVLLSGYLPFDDSNLVSMYKKIYKREYSFPAWISRSSRCVISQLLDPNPNTRMSIEGLMNTAWFKKALELKKQDVCLFEKESLLGKDCRTMNAFDIISLSSGLDLSGLFETTNKRGKRFTSMASVGAVEERVREVGGKLGYKVENGKNGSIGLGKGRSLLLVQALEMTESLLWVEVKVIDGVVEFEELHWGDLKASLEDVVLSWHNEAI